MNAQAVHASRARRAGRWIPYALFALWLLVMLSVPIVRRSGDAALAVAVALGVVAQAAASLSFLWHAWGTRQVLIVAATIAPLAWLLEFVGSATGVPFGRYHYTTALQPQLLGVPLLIPLAWLMMLPAAWAVADLIVGRENRLRFILVAAAAFTAWDLFLDPQMVDWGYWVWADPRGYFGIPWTNYLGWLAGSAALTAAVFLPPWSPPALPAQQLLLLYTVTWLLQSFALAVFWQMPGPALVGFVVMGAFALLGWQRLRARAPGATSRLHGEAGAQSPSAPSS